MSLYKYPNLVILTLNGKNMEPIELSISVQPVANISSIWHCNFKKWKLTYFLHQMVMQQPKMKKIRILAPIAVIALWVSIPPLPPVLSAKSSNSSLSSSIFVAAKINKLVFQFVIKEALMLGPYSKLSFYKG